MLFQAMSDHGSRLQLDGRSAPPEPPRYDRDHGTEAVRLFEFPTGIRGQLALDTDRGEE